MLHRLREEGAIGDEAFHRLEEEVDWAELCAAPAGAFQPLLTDGEAPRPQRGRGGKAPCISGARSSADRTPARPRQALLQRLGAFTLPLPAGEHCTQLVNVEATVGKTTKLSLKVSDALGVRDSDSLQFKCVAAAP